MDKKTDLDEFERDCRERHAYQALAAIERFRQRKAAREKAKTDALLEKREQT